MSVSKVKCPCLQRTTIWKWTQHTKASLCKTESSVSGQLLFYFCLKDCSSFVFAWLCWVLIHGCIKIMLLNGAERALFCHHTYRGKKLYKGRIVATKEGKSSPVFCMNLITTNTSSDGLLASYESLLRQTQNLGSASCHVVVVTVLSIAFILISVVTVVSSD